MKLQEALSILRPKTDSLEDLKRAYREACKMYHPDINPTGLDMMKLINAAYDLLKTSDYSYLMSSIEEDPNLSELILEIYSKIKHLPGIKIELCGVWLWVSGTTKNHKDYLKAQGFKWSPKKLMWSWHHGKHQRWTKKTWAMDKIRTMYGSKGLKTEEAGAIS